LRMRTHLTQKSQTLDDSMVQIDEFGFAELVNVNLCHGL
jgi:hypothetical protein